VLSVVAIVIGLLALSERPSKNHVLLNVFLQPVLFVGLIVNNRRLAFVHLAVSLVTIVILGPPRVRQFLKQSVVVVVPALLLYTAVGWNSSAGVFRPIKIFRSVSAQQDDSSKTRDIENYNLIQTLKTAPILGSGFGHEYREVVQANRVDQFFAQYRFIAHNSVLWLLSLSGWIGFTFIWVLFPTAVLITLQVKRFAAGAVDRVTAGATLCALICFMLQAWGDMGLQSWMSALVLTSLAGSTGAMWTASFRSGRLA